jgi:hypothetical protein
MSTLQVDTDELVKNPELKMKDLQELKCWLATQEHLPPISGRVFQVILILTQVESSELIKKGNIYSL